MSELLALLPDQESRVRVRFAMGASDVRFVDRGEELLRHVALRTSASVLVSARDPMGAETAPLVRRIREGFRSTVILGYCEYGRSDADIASLVRAGVDDLVFRGADDVRVVLQEILVRAVRHSVAAQVIEDLGDALPPKVRPIVAHLLEHAGDPPTVDATAAALGVNRKTLVNRVARAHLPAPSTLIAWARLLAAGRLLEDAGRSVEQVAHLLNFESPNALRNMIKRHTGLRPLEVREHGGLACVLRLFRAALLHGPAEADPATAH